MEEKEYELKWQYIMHMENAQARFIQWYFAIITSVCVFIYTFSHRITNSALPREMTNHRWIPLVILTIYSILTCIRLIVQKRNYDVYTARLRSIEGNAREFGSIRNKIFSVFKLQYYIICFTGGIVSFASVYEIRGVIWLSLAVGAGYVMATTALSFTKLIER